MLSCLNNLSFVLLSIEAFKTLSLCYTKICPHTGVRLLDACARGTNEGCGLGLHILPYVEQTTIRATNKCQYSGGCIVVDRRKGK